MRLSRLSTMVLYECFLHCRHSLLEVGYLPREHWHQPPGGVCWRRRLQGRHCSSLSQRHCSLQCCLSYHELQFRKCLELSQCSFLADTLIKFRFLLDRMQSFSSRSIAGLASLEKSVWQRMMQRDWTIMFYVRTWLYIGAVYVEVNKLKFALFSRWNLLIALA